MSEVKTREVDAQVAELVMGWSPSSSDFYDWDAPNGERIGDGVGDGFRPSSDSDDRDAVVEEMFQKGWLFDLCRKRDGWVCNGHQYKLPARGAWGDAMNTSGFVQEIGDTAGEAVCRAALAAEKEGNK